MTKRVQELFDLTGRSAIVTGGSRGIGKEMAEALAEAGANLMLCARRADWLEETVREFAGGGFNVASRICDVSKPEDVQAVVDATVQEFGAVDILINNAGIQNWMNVADKDFYQKTNDEITTNVIAPLHLTSLFCTLNALTTIINVTSGLAFIPLSKVAVYSATKAFMRSFTLSLRHMLKERNIEVIEMIPPALNSDLLGKGIHDGQPAVSDFVESIFTQLRQGKTELTFGTSEARANANNQVIAEYFSKMNP